MKVSLQITRNVASIFTVLFVAMSASFAQTNQTIEPANTIELHHYGKNIALTENEAQTFNSKSVKLLETSEFNSDKGHWPVYGVQNEYALTLSGKYLLISFKAPLKVKTTAGEIVVQEIVLGLDGSHFSGMFTIDLENRVIEQGKYRGDEWIDLMKLADQIANGR